MIEITSRINITPRVMAEAFWGMTDNEQAQFFAELHDVITTTSPHAYSLGEMQWCYLSDELNKNAKAKEMACAMTAWVFVKFMESQWNRK